MKSFAFALLFVAAAYASPDAEADPALFYSNLGYNYGINGYAGYAVGNRVFNTYAAAPVAAAIATPAVATVAAPAVAAPIVKSVVAAPAVADVAVAAEPVVAAEPLVKTVVSTPAITAAAVTPAVATTVAAPAAIGYAANTIAHLPYNYGYTGLYNGLYGYSGLHNYGFANTHLIAKREAEAESEADPALFYSGLYNNYAYTSPLAYAAAPYASRAFAYGYNYGLPYSYGAYAGYPYAAARYLY